MRLQILIAALTFGCAAKQTATPQAPCPAPPVREAPPQATLDETFDDESQTRIEELEDEIETLKRAIEERDSDVNSLEKKQKEVVAEFCRQSSGGKLTLIVRGPGELPILHLKPGTHKVDEKSCTDMLTSWVSVRFNPYFDKGQ